MKKQWMDKHLISGLFFDRWNVGGNVTDHIF